jgi:arylsulfatase A
MKRSLNNTILSGLLVCLRYRITPLILAILAVDMLMGTAHAEETKKKQIAPNIILIMADDMGFECIGVNGCEDYKTPVLDKLAAEGVRFTNAFANPICTPSRVKIMTGQYNVRNYVRFGLLEKGQKTFAHALKNAGYATCIAGKWQLGREKNYPQHFGFEQSCLWQHTRPRVKTVKGKRYDSRYGQPYLEINGREREYGEGEYGPQVCADFVCDFVQKNRDKPFLVYYPMILTHCPFDPTPDSEEWDPKRLGSTDYKGDVTKHKKLFGDMVTYADKIVGQIDAKLRGLGIRENTLLIFTGDNGTDKPIITNCNGMEVVGGKGQMNDNGTRTPLIVSWPGTIQKGVVADTLVDFTDMFPTICEAVGVKMPEEYPGDGVSFFPVLTGEERKAKPWVYFWYRGQVFARTKEYKYLCMEDLSNPRLFDVSKPYNPKPLGGDSGEDTLSNKEQKAIGMLKEVVEELSKTRPKRLKKNTKQ